MQRRTRVHEYMAYSLQRGPFLKCVPLSKQQNSALSSTSTPLYTQKYFTRARDLHTISH